MPSTALDAAGSLVLRTRPIAPRGSIALAPPDDSPTTERASSTWRISPFERPATPTRFPP
jgi:hypothetical protein